MTTDNRNVLVGTRIKQARELRNMTLDDIAAETQMAKSTIQRYEVAKIKTLKMPVLEAIARALNVNPSWLVGKDVPMELPSDTDKFKEWAEAFNATHSPLMLNDEEKRLIEKYRILDTHGKDVVSTILDKEHSRCLDEESRSFVVTREMLEAMPFEERLAFLKYEDDPEIKLVARKRGR